MAMGLKYMPYEERLARLGLTTLTIRRRRGDLIQIFKIVHGLDDISFIDKKLDKSTLLSTSSSTRGHNLRLTAENFPAATRNNLSAAVTRRDWYLTNRSVNLWNALPESLVHSSTINGFKNGLDKILPQLCVGQQIF